MCGLSASFLFAIVTRLVDRETRVLPREKPTRLGAAGELTRELPCDPVIARLGEIAGVKGARPRRFRDTWAKTALLEGKPMRTVQLVLGHQSIKTTEEHYAPFVPEYQDMIEPPPTRSPTA